MKARGSPPRVAPRLVTLGVVFFLLTAGLVTRLVDLQVARPDRYEAYGASQRVRTVVLPGRRGDILDRNGERLAMSIAQDTVWADPRLVTDPVAEARALAPVLGLPERSLADKLRSPGAFVYLARKVSDDVAAEVAALDLDGVFFLDEETRFNPAGTELAKAVLGTAGMDNDGLSGLEEQYDSVLAGLPGQISVEQAPAGQTIASGSHEVEPAERGADLVTTLDRSLQFEAEEALAEHVERTGSDAGVVVIMQRSTGDVLAMASVAIGDDGRAQPTTENLAVTWAYEPGSVTKAITLSAVLEEGVATPEDVLSVPSDFALYDAVFHDSSPHPTQEWSVIDILTRSSNVGTIMWSLDLGSSLLDEYLRRFGFGEPTALGFKGETPGLLRPVDEWSGTSIATVAIGQGMSVTPIQMVTALNAIANDGEYVPPRLVAELVTSDGERNPVAGPEPHRIISVETADQMEQMLANVVAVGTGQQAAVPGYRVAGKTGTARKPLPTGGYEDAAGNYRYITTFGGFYPAGDPEFSMVVVLDEPSSSIYAGDTAAPLFAELAHYTVRHYQVPPPVAVVTEGTELVAEAPPPGLARSVAASVPDGSGPESPVPDEVAVAPIDGTG